MPTALDSGIVSRAGERAEIKSQLQSAVAHQLGIPVTSWSADYLTVFRSYLKDMELPDIPADLPIEQFASKIKDRLPEYAEFIGRIEEMTLLSSVSFPHPLYRSLKDYYLVRIAEGFQLYWFLEGVTQEIFAKEIIEFFPFPMDGRFRICLIKDKTGIFQFGPTFCDVHIDEGTDRKYRDELDGSISQFKQLVKIVNADINSGHLHGDEQIRRAVFSRQKILTENFSAKCRTAISVLRLESDLIQYPDIERCPPNFFSKLLAATMVAIEEPSGYVFSHKQFHADCVVTVNKCHVVIKDDNLKLIPTRNIASSVDHALIYQRYIEVSFANWNMFIAESNNLLKNWLQKNSGALGPSFQAEEQQENFGLRLARFLTFLFNGSECSIYQLHYVNESANLISFSGYSRYPDANIRLNSMAEHIKENINRISGDDSIVIRAFRENEIQYCQMHDQEAGKYNPEHQKISYPSVMINHDWGVSLCAVPIRVSGIFWGVIELVAMRPHSFPDVVRSKLSEVVGTVAPYLFERKIFSTLSEINQVVVANRTAQEKKVLLEPLIRQLFGAKTVAIIRLDGARHQDVKTFLQIGRADVEDATSTHDQSGYEYLKPYIKFSDETGPIWYCNIGDRQFRKRFSGITEKKFFQDSAGDFLCLARVEWSGNDAEIQSGVAILTYTHKMDSQENWRSVVEFACQYIATVTASLYGNEQWETTVREKLAHELSKSVGALRATTKRLENAVSGIPRKTTGLDKPLMENIVRDLKRHERSLDTNTKILKLNRVTRDFDNDPRLYYVDNVINEWRQSNHNRYTSFREIYNSIFIGASSDFNSKKISVPPLDRGFDPKFYVDDWCLGEVLLTIKSNILKYGMEGTEVLIRENSAINYGVRISNIGLRLEVDELRKIFFDEFRGQRAKDAHPEDGSGFGLWYADRVMKELGCDIRHAQTNLADKSDTKGSFVWHHFTLSFPHSKVRL